MNELGKLISSLLLLGAGFFAASFVGPPEVVDRLAHYLKPSGQPDEDGLRPLPPATPTASSTDPWPSLPAQPPANAGTVGQDRTAASPIAPVAARVASASWLGGAESSPAAPPLESNDWPTLEPPPRPETAADDRWLTAATLGDAPSANTRPHAGPIPRSGRPAPPADPGFDAADSAAEASGWPRLAPPNREPAPAPTPITSQRPTLEASPYGGRPRFTPSEDAYSADHNPLRYEPIYPETEAIARRQVAPRHGEHIVTDGDTLAQLAERYLGDADRARELFELNTDRLEEPDVLPIGLVLRTPDRPRRLPRPATPPAERGFPTLERPGSFATLAASDAGQKLTRDPFPIERRPLTSAAADPESVRPVDPPTEPVYDREVMWDPGRW